MRQAGIRAVGRGANLVGGAPGDQVSRCPPRRPVRQRPPVHTTSDPLPFGALDLDPDEVRARFAWAKSQGRPYFVWPELTPEAWRRGLEAIGEATAALVAGRPGASLEGSADARALGIAAFTSGTGPLLGWWIERGTLDAPDDVARLLALHLEHGRRRASRIEGAFADVARRLADVGARATVVKGFHTARAFFPDPGTRPVSDVDLVVSPADLPRAVRALTEAGFTAREVLHDPYMSEWSPPGERDAPASLELTHVANAWGIDLHGSFDRDFGGARRVRAVPRGAAVTEPWPEGGPAIDALVQPWLVSYLAAHASQELKNLMLVRIVELVLVIRDGVARGTLDWPVLRESLVADRAIGFVFPALALAEKLAPGTVEPTFLRAAADGAPARVRRIVAGLEPWSAQRLDGVSLEEQFMWADSPLSYLGRVRRALWPAWVGPLPAMLRLQLVRLRQLVGGKVSIGRPRPRSGD